METIKVKLDTPLRGFPVYVEIPTHYGADSLRFNKAMCNEILANLVDDEMRRREGGVICLVQMEQPIVDAFINDPWPPTRDIPKEHEDRLRRQRQVTFLLEEFKAFHEAMFQNIVKLLSDRDQWGKIGELEFLITVVVQPRGTTPMSKP